MSGLLGMIIFGLVVGALAKLVMPGRDPGGIIVTILLGIAGSLLGGYFGRMMGFYQAGQAAGFLMSLAGAILLLILYRVLVKRPS
ncbi:MAG TPA: GlsB/YeaQ/YmgE family stress response membrane protein [Acidobacteriota bacterium]